MSCAQVPYWQNIYSAQKNRIIHLSPTCLTTMHKKIHTSAPSHYHVCIHKDCPMAGKCLHRDAYTDLVKSEETLVLLNPDKCSKDCTCQYFRDNTPVKYAKGFKNFQKRMTQEQYSKFTALLKHKLGHNPYYYRRNGKTLISPMEQHLILSTLHDAGIEEDWEFDMYVDSCLWND